MAPRQFPQRQSKWSSGNKLTRRNFRTYSL